jgi:hypothetical protein
MTTTMNFDAPVNGVNSNINNDVIEIINGIDNGICTVKCVSATTSVDTAGDFRITRRLECIWNKDAITTDRIIDLEIAGAPGATPVVTLNGQLLPSASVVVCPNGIIEIRNLKGMMIDRVQLPINANATLAGAAWQGLTSSKTAPAFAGQVLGGNGGYTPYGQYVTPMNAPYATNPVPFNGFNALGTTAAPTLTRKPIIGISIRQASSELVHHVAIDARNVCVINEVLPGSPAFNAGIKPNDVILSVNGKQASPATLRHELGTCKLGQAIRLVVLGKGVKREVDVNFDVNFATGTAPISTQFPGAPVANVPFGFAGYNAMGPAYGFGTGYGKGFTGYCPVTGACGSLNMGGFEPTAFGGFTGNAASRMGNGNKVGSIL